MERGDDQEMAREQKGGRVMDELETDWVNVPNDDEELDPDQWERL